jgi:hypothetical protein
VTRLEGPILRFALDGPHGLAVHERGPGDAKALFRRATTRRQAELAGLPVLSSARADTLGWF